MQRIRTPLRPQPCAACVWLGLILTASAHAQTAPSPAGHGADAEADPYTARVPMAAQDSALRDAALREALGIVLMRVSGNAGDGVIETLSAAAPQLVQTYGYQRDAQGALLLRASFDRQAVDARLRAAGLPVWGNYAGPAQRFSLTLTGVRDGSRYLSALRRVEQIDGVRSVTLIAAQGDTLQLSVEAEGGRERFRAAIANAGADTQRWLPITESGDGLAYRLL